MGGLFGGGAPEIPPAPAAPPPAPPAEPVAEILEPKDRDEESDKSLKRSNLVVPRSGINISSGISGINI